MKLKGILLCGGKSSRMGEDKGLVDFKGEAMANYPLKVLEALTSDILISSNNPEYKKFGYPILKDEIQNIGPLGGLYACMKSSSAEHFFVTSCDTPFVNKQLALQVLSFSKESNIVVAQTEDNRVHPLFGYYSKDILHQIEIQIKQGNYKMLDLLKACNAYTVPVISYNPVTRIDLLKNINKREEID